MTKEDVRSRVSGASGQQAARHARESDNKENLNMGQRSMSGNMTSKNKRTSDMIRERIEQDKRSQFGKMRPGTARS